MRCPHSGRLHWTWEYQLGERNDLVGQQGVSGNSELWVDLTGIWQVRKTGVGVELTLGKERETPRVVPRWWLVQLVSGWCHSLRRGTFGAMLMVGGSKGGGDEFSVWWVVS